MGLSDLLMIVASVLISSAIVGVLHLMGRTGRFPMLPARWSPLAIALALSFGSALILVGLATIPSSSSAADRTDGGEAATVVDDRPKIHVYPFESYGSNLRRDAVGADLARAIREILVDRGLAARKGVEHSIPLDIFHMEHPSDDLLAHYRRRVPFTCAWGSVASTREGSLEIQVNVASVDRSIRPTERLVKTITVPDSDAAVGQATQELAAAIAEVMQDG